MSQSGCVLKSGKCCYRYCSIVLCCGDEVLRRSDVAEVGCGVAVAMAIVWWKCGGALSDGVVAVVWWVWRWCSEGVAVV